jgi:hypothetical protein
MKQAWEIGKLRKILNMENVVNIAFGEEEIYRLTFMSADDTAMRKAIYS